MRTFGSFVISIPIYGFGVSDGFRSESAVIGMFMVRRDGLFEKSFDSHQLPTFLG